MSRKGTVIKWFQMTPWKKGKFIVVVVKLDEGGTHEQETETPTTPTDGVD